MGDPSQGEVLAETEVTVKAYVLSQEGRDAALFKPADDLEPAEKAVVVQYANAQAGTLTQAPNAFVSDYETVQAFALAGALAPPEDPRQVANVYRRSSSLRPCVEALATNTTSFGHSYEPVIDLDHADADERIYEAILQDRLVQGDEREPTPADVAATRDEIKRGSLREKFKLERFFQYLCPTRSFNELRWETRVEREGGGNAYWEVTRRNDGGIATMDRIEAHTMRLRRTEERHLDVEVWQRRSPLSYERVTVKRRFRTYVQIVLGGAKAVYFKEFGDPRVLSSATGRFYPSVQFLQAAEGSTPPATEIIHWRVFDTIGPYGLPRWYGAQYAVMGILASERVNYDYFDNKAIPPYAVLVSGGKLRDGGIDLIKQAFANIRGQASWHKTLVLEAEGVGHASSAAGAKCTIEFVPLLKDQPQDALFQVYEANNARKIQQQWRLHDAIVGRSQEANRAQIEGVIQIADQQVFQPMRESEDDFFNRFVLPELGVRFWRFKTNSPITTDATKQTELATAWVKGGVLTPNEGREIAGEVFNRDYAPVEEAWGDIPQPLILAGILPGVKADGSTHGVTEADASLAQRIVALRDSLRAQAESGAAAEEAGGRARDAVETRKVDMATWNRWFES